jgi:hypothetical protein
MSPKKRGMPVCEITINKNIVSICMKNGYCSSEEIENLSKFYCLLVGSEVQANDSICYVLMFKEEMWIVPEVTTGAYDLKKWIEPIVDEEKIIVAQIDYLPFSWRFRPFLLGLEAKLAIRSKKEFKEIEKKICVLESSSIHDIF